MLQKLFAENVITRIKDDPNVIGLAAAGSWITNELDEYSDLDLVLVTKEQIAGDREKMIAFASKLGKLVNAFTGEHVGEPRVLICLYDEPLLHVDIKFLTLPEFEMRVEDPVVLFECEGQLTNVIRTFASSWPQPDLQWIEDRFWTWIHYLGTKFGRGEYFECIDGLAFIRSRVLSPLLQVKNKLQARGLRKVETRLPANDLEDLKNTIAAYDRNAIILAVENSIELYRKLRRELFSEELILRPETESRALKYFREVILI